MTRRGGKVASERSRGIGEDERKRVMVLLAARLRCSNLVKLVALARRSALLAPSAIPSSLSPLISRIPFFLFSDWRRTVSSKFFDTGPLYFHRGTCASSSCSLYSLSSTLQRTQPTVNFLSLYDWSLLLGLRGRQ